MKYRVKYKCTQKERIKNKMKERRRYPWKCKF